MDLKIINNSKHALPEYKTKGSVGLDLMADIDNPILLKSRDTKIIPTHLAIELPEGYEAQIRPRSGLASQGIVAQLGTIDSDYRGEIGIIITNNGYFDYRITDGMRLAQMVINKVEVVNLVPISTFTTATDRGTQGFGHTGI